MYRIRFKIQQVMFPHPFCRPRPPRISGGFANGRGWNGKGMNAFRWNQPVKILLDFMCIVGEGRINQQMDIIISGITCHGLR